MSDEWEPLTDGQLRAMRECRFVTVKRDRSEAFGMDYDAARVTAVGFNCFPYKRAPGLMDYEWRTSHPDMIEAVAQHTGLSRG